MEESVEIKQKVKKSLKYSIIDGSLYSAMVGFGESFFSAFAVFLKANNFQLGLLTALPQTLGSLAQSLSNKLIKLFGNSRKKLCLTFAYFQAFMHILIAIAFFMGELKVWSLIAAMCLYWIFGMLCGPAWSSWIGELVNEKERGTYFSKRSKIANLVTFIAYLLAGYVLQQFAGDTTIEYIGFALIFSIAFIFRLLSIYYLSKEYEPNYEIVEEAQFSFFEFVKQAPFRNYGRYVFYLCFMNFAIFLAAPFFTAYMLKDLNMSYLTFTLINGMAIIAKYITLPVWGKLADKYGTKRILAISGFLMPIIPLLWIFSTDIWYLYVLQIYSGIVWAGFDIASSNYIYDCTSPQRRVICITYYNMLNGGFILAGSLLGSLVVKFGEGMFWSAYLFVFLVSFILRILTSLIFIPILKEMRKVDNITYPRLIIKLFSTWHHETIMHNFITLRNKFEKDRDEEEER